jgi:uncharacterized membrane protein
MIGWLAINDPVASKKMLRAMDELRFHKQQQKHPSAPRYDRKECKQFWQCSTESFL